MLVVITNPFITVRLIRLLTRSVALSSFSVKTTRTIPPSFQWKKRFYKDVRKLACLPQKPQPAQFFINGRKAFATRFTFPWLSMSRVIYGTVYVIIVLILLCLLFRKLKQDAFIKRLGTREVKQSCRFVHELITRTFASVNKHAVMRSMRNIIRVLLKNYPTVWSKKIKLLICGSEALIHIISTHWDCSHFS